MGKEVSVESGTNYTFRVDMDNPLAVPEVKNGNAKLEYTVIDLTEGIYEYSIPNINADADIQVYVKNPVTVTAMSGEGYEITDVKDDKIPESQVVACESEYSFKVRATDDSYEVKEVRVNNSLVSKDATTGIYKTEKLTENATITVQAAIKKFDINYTADGEGYTVSMPGSKTVDYGSDIMFYVYPKPGYETPKVYVIPKTQETLGENDKPITGNNNMYSYSNVTENKRIYVAAGAAVEYQVILEEGDGYTFESITNDGKSTNDTAFKVGHGKDIAFKINPADGYTVSQVLCNGLVIDPDPESGLYVLAEITANATVTVKASKNTYPVELSGDVPNGYTFIPGASTVEHGNNYEFSIIPNEGQQAANVKYTVGDDATEKSATSTGDGKYVITSVKGKITIKIEDGGKKPQTITYNGRNCSFVDAADVSKQALEEVKYGADYKFKLKLNEGCSLSDNATVSINGATYDASTETTYSTGKITGDVIVSVTGVVQNGSVQIKDTTTDKNVLDENNVESIQWECTGITKEQANSVPYGGSINFKVVPNRGYEVVSVVRGGTELKPVNGFYTVNDIKSDTTVYVTVDKCAAVKVILEDSKFGTHDEKIYDITEMVPISENNYGKLVEPKRDTNAYIFDGWYSGTKKVEYITEDMSGKEITLTAKWSLNETEWLGINTTGSAEVNDTTLYNVTFNTIASFAEDLTELDRQGIKVTGFGTFYTPDKLEISNSTVKTNIVDYITSRSRETSNILTKQIANDRLYNYYANCDLKTEDFDKKAFAIAVTLSDKDIGNRFAAGWLELDFNGKRIIVVSNFVSATKAESKMAKLAE